MQAIVAYAPNDYRLEEVEMPRAGPDDIIIEIKDMTGGCGYDVYIEATGHTANSKQGLDMIRKLGRFVEFSMFGQDVTVDWSMIGARKELDLYGAHLRPYCYPFSIAALSDGRLPTECAATHQLKMSKSKTGFDLMQQSDKSIKILLIPGSLSWDFKSFVSHLFSFNAVLSLFQAGCHP